jgi:hypothetical protein
LGFRFGVFFFGIFFLGVFGLSNSCECFQYYNLILAGRIAQGTTAVDGLQKKRQILVLCVSDEFFCLAFLVVIVIVVLVTDVLEGTHECTTARSFVRPNFEREGVDAWRERRGGCGVGWWSCFIKVNKDSRAWRVYTSFL